MNGQDYKAPESVDRLRQRALIAGVIGVVICAVGASARSSPESSAW